MKERLTPPQRELERLARERQKTYGKARVRVQSNLVWAGLARFTDKEGTTVPVCNEHGYKNWTDWCEITDAGRAALAQPVGAKL